jgi:GNAT superfamily N-acetyltransferase
MQQPVRLESIADHLDLVATISNWHFEEWRNPTRGDSLTAWSTNLGQYANRDRISTSFVALTGTEPLGSVSLSEQKMSTHPELSSWLSGMYVKPLARGRGVARALVLHALA